MKSLKELREERNLTIKDFASLSGLTPAQISNFENKVSCPQVATIKKMADALDISFDDLYKIFEN